MSARSWLKSELARQGVSRREFMAFCTTMAAALSLPESAAAQIARAVTKADKPVLVWLEFQDCAGNTESFLRASRPTAAEIVLDTLSVDYHETIMAAAGRAGRRESRPDGQGPGRSVHRGRRGLDPDRRQRRLLHDWRAFRPRHRA